MTDSELVAPRALTKADRSHLRTMFELQLNITCQDDEEDAEDLIDYALDMIGRGKNVGSVVEELEFMEYEVCDHASALKIGKCLSSFLREIAREMAGHHTKIDLSTKAASRKHSKEMHQTLLSGSVSAKARAKGGIYNSKGELKKQWAGFNPADEIDFEERRRKVLQEAVEERKKSGLALSAKSSAVRAYEEVGALDTSNNEIKGQIYDEKGQLVAAWNSRDELDDDVEVNLSARASAAKHHGEVDSMLTDFRTKNEGGIVIKHKIYKKDGQLNSWNQRIEESTPKEMDLSTMGNLKKKRQELERLRSTGSQRRGVKNRIYSEDGQLNAWNKLKPRAEVIVTDEEEWAPAPVRSASERSVEEERRSLDSEERRALDEERRREFQSIMRDRSLNREERAKKIEEIKKKYAARAASSTMSEASDEKKGEANNERCSKLKFMASRYKSTGAIVRDAPNMDLSTSGSIRKKEDELNAIRATGQMRRGVKGKIYDSSGRLNAWSRWEQKDELVERQTEQDMDLTARGMEMKKAREIESLRSSMTTRSKPQMYDADGNIVGASNNEGEQDRHNPQMDLSAAGMMRKKSQEMELLRATANPRGLKQRMYNERGELVGSINNDGEQDRHNPDMDLSAEGMKLKKAREMEALRRAGRGLKEGAKKSMYDESGQLNAWNKKQKNGDTAQMDLSTIGSIKKKDAELDAIRATGQQRRGVKGKIYDSSGQLNAWTSLKEEDDGIDAEFEQDMDLSAEGMKLKKAREIESLRSSMTNRSKPQMYDADGNIVGAINNEGEQYRHNQDMDLSAEGMKRKMSQEMEFLRATANPKGLKQKMYNERGEIVSALNNDGEQNSHNTQMDVTASGMMMRKKIEIAAILAGSVDHKATVAPRALTDEEASSLRTALKSQLKIPNDSYEEDASDLLDYAFDMIGDGKPVGKLTEELVFMEMDVLTAEMADDFEKCLSSYLIRLGGDVTLAKRSKMAIYDEDGNIIDKKNKECDKSEEHRIDLSTSAAAQRPGREMQSTLLSGAVSAKERSQQGIYNSQGELVNQWASVEGKKTSPNQRDGNGSETGILQKRTAEEKALELQRKQEFQALMRDRTLSREERALRIEEMKKKYSASSNPVSEKDAQKDTKLDLSALAFARKAKAEMKAALLSSEKSAKERSKQEIYDSNGVLIKQWDLEGDEDEVAVHGINLSAQAAANRAAMEVDSLLVKEKSGGGVRDRMSEYKKFVKPKGLYHHEGDDHDDARMKGLDLSAKAFAKKPAQEVSATLSTGAESLKERSKQGIYDSNGVLIKQWANVEQQDVEDIDAFVDEQRKLYFQQFEDDKIRQDQIAEMDQLLAEQHKYGQANGNSGGPEFRMSAQSQARKPQEEIRALRAIADSEGVKKEIYDENGVLFKQWANFNEDGSPAQLSEDERRREELYLIMNDHSLSHDEREKRIKEVKARYAGASASNQVGGNGASASELFEKMADNSALDEQRRQAFQAIMRDRSLSREERALRIEEMKRRYTSSPSASQGSGQPVASPGRDTGEGSKLDLSALAFARKTSAEVKATLLTSETSAKERSKQDIYDSNGVLIKQWANVNEEDQNEVVAEKQSFFKSFMAKSVDEQRRDEIQLIMRDRSLTKEERADRIEEVKARYAAAAAGEQGNAPAQDIPPPPKTASSPKTPPSNLIGKNLSLDAQRRKELKSIMKNRSLDVEEKNRLMEEIKLKYDLIQAEEEGKVIESKASAEVTQLDENKFESIDSTDVTRLEENGVERNASIEATQVEENGVETNDSADVTQLEENGVERNASIEETQVEENGAETGSIHVTQEEGKGHENNDPIDAIQVEGKVTESNNSSEAIQNEERGTERNDLIETAREEEKAVINRSVEEIQGGKEGSEGYGSPKDVHDVPPVEPIEESRDEGNGQPSDVHDDCPIDLSAASFSQKHLKELEAIKAKTAKGTSIKDRKAAFNNDTTVYYDSVQFAASQHKSKSARQTAQREAVQSASKYNYSYDDGGAKTKARVDETTAVEQGAKVPTKSYRAKQAPTINCDPLAFAVKNNKSEAARKAVKRDTKESAKLYNYTYGDGGVVEETSADFKAMGDDDKAAKKKAKESAKSFKHELTPNIDCDPLAFAMKNNKSKAAQRAVKRDTKESSKYYDYRYTG